MDSKVFDELMDNYVVTQVGLKCEEYKDLDDLKNNGIATSISADEVYENAIKSVETEEKDTETDIVVDEDE